MILALPFRVLVPRALRFRVCLVGAKPIAFVNAATAHLYKAIVPAGALPGAFLNVFWIQIENLDCRSFAHDLVPFLSKNYVQINPVVGPVKGLLAIISQAIIRRDKPALRYPRAGMTANGNREIAVMRGAVAHA
jgi:hypothetical protein